MNKYSGTDFFSLAFTSSWHQTGKDICLTLINGFRPSRDHVFPHMPILHGGLVNAKLKRGTKPSYIHKHLFPDFWPEAESNSTTNVIVQVEPAMVLYFTDLIFEEWYILRSTRIISGLILKINEGTYKKLVISLLIILVEVELEWRAHPFHITL